MIERLERVLRRWMFFRRP